MTMKRFESVKVFSPERSHSYIECNKDFGLLNQKITVGVPHNWINAISTARVKPSPFVVMQVDQEIILKWNDFLSVLY